MDDHYRRALDAAMADITSDPEVIGVLFTGSVQQGRPGTTSDLDLYVVTQKDQYWRATRVYVGVTAELFINNVASMRWRITRPDEIAAMAGFATGDVLLDTTGQMAELKAIARQRWEAGPPAPTEEQVIMLRYTLFDLHQDLQDVEHDPTAAKVAGHHLVSKALEAWCKLNRYFGDKPKRIVAYVAERDPLLGVLLKDYYACGQHPKHAQEIVEYVLAPVGGMIHTWDSNKITYTGGA